ncbi:MAG: hypothetical protein QOJ84_921 [Bradyrhizobium sp.]|nr:hypothetical protein [Bradyrhizobium sp.]
MVPIKPLTGTSGNGPALISVGTRGECHAGIIVMGRPCRDLRWWRRLFPGACDALKQHIRLGRPRAGKLAGPLFANSKQPPEGQNRSAPRHKNVPLGLVRCYFFPARIRVSKCSIAVSTLSSCKVSNLVPGNGRSSWTNAPPNPEKPKPEGWQSAPWSFWSISCWRESPSRRPLNFSI